MSVGLPIGQRVVVSEFAENPMEAIEHYLSLATMPAPDPATLMADDVIIAIKSASVGWVDLLMTSGQYQHMPAPPYCPGLEYSGVVVWTGAAVDTQRISIGDRVLVDGFMAGPRSGGAYQAYGGYASYGVAPQAAVHRIPPGLAFYQACCLLGNYETA